MNFDGLFSNAKRGSDEFVWFARNDMSKNFFLSICEKFKSIFEGLGFILLGLILFSFFNANLNGANKFRVFYWFC